MNGSGSVWTRFAIMALGLWMIASPFTFGTEGDATRGSDVVCGALLLFFGRMSFMTEREWPLWVVCLVGVWMQFAPLAFWADKTFYLNNTVIGFLAMALAIVLPSQPREERFKGGGIPPGWSYNPSSFMQRLPLVFLGLLAWFFARYMAAYQLGYIDHIWDPFFGEGTKNVITSSISKKFPIPDAGLGAMAYTIETLMACHGGTRRWHTIPWFVTLFAVLVIPVGLTSIILIILQPVVVGSWCTWCLLTALCMLVMIALAVDEVVAVWEFLQGERERGVSYWEAFWRGGSVPDAREDFRSPPPEAPMGEALPAMFTGVGLPWNLVLTTLLGIWLLFSPQTLGLSGAAAASVNISGALAVTFSVISMAEVVRAGRFIVALIGVFVMVTPWLFSGDSPVLHQVIVGLLLFLLSLPKGGIWEQYGRWNKKIV